MKLKHVGNEAAYDVIVGRDRDLLVSPARPQMRWQVLVFDFESVMLRTCNCEAGRAVRSRMIERSFQT